MCLVEVLFESDNTEQVIFPHPKAISNQDGIAVNYIQRIIANPSNVKTAIWVSSGSVRIGPIPVIGLGRITDLFPFNFNAPPLAAFDGRRQILLGGFGYITPMPVGTKVRAWAIDPTVAEPSVGTIISSPINAHQQPILFEVIAHKLGTTVFILESTDNSIYEARITGVLDPEFIRGDCDGNRVLAITDAITALEYLFRGRASPPVREACNTNDDRRLDVTDAVYLLMHLSLSGPEPPPPYPDPGTDPTP